MRPEARTKRAWREGAELAHRDCANGRFCSANCVTIGGDESIDRRRPEGGRRVGGDDRQDRSSGAVCAGRRLCGGGTPTAGAQLSEPENESPPWLCRIRTELAAGELASKQGGSSHLEGVANRLGYRDERRLREAVGSAYGLSPSEVRRGARIERNLRLDEQIRAGYRGRKTTVGVWTSAYRRRRNQEDLQRLLRKANPEGAKIILGQVKFPRPAKAREEAAELATSRALQLYAAVRGELRQVA